MGSKTRVSSKPTSAGTAKASVDRMNRPAWAAKWFAVILYHELLSYIGGWVATRDFKLWSFLLISPLVKYLFLFKRLPTMRSKKEFALSVFGDTIQAFVLHRFVFVYLVGSYFCMFPILQALAVLALELLCFFTLDWRNPKADPMQATFTVRLSKNPLDSLFTVCIALIIFWSGYAIPEFGASVTGFTLLAQFVTLVQGDLVFGVLHYLAHRIPSLWRSHKLHHEYKREELNSLATFYADLPDSVMMNMAIVLTAASMHFWGGPFAHEILVIEGIYPAFYSHSKYPTLFCSYLYYYELDLLDIVFGLQRAPELHHGHHHNGGANFGLFGAHSDEFIKKLVDPFLPNQLVNE